MKIEVTYSSLSEAAACKLTLRTLTCNCKWTFRTNVNCT